MIFFWDDYFDTEVNLYQLITKNTNLETAIYRAINLYYMIIFNNFTIYDATKFCILKFMIQLSHLLFLTIFILP